MNEIQPYQNQPLAVSDLRTNINAIQHALKSVMIEGTHYGKIPGTQKPSLWKAGAEVIAATFGISSEIDAEDLGVNGEVRYRVKVRGISRSGITVGEGIGECSSREEKYLWRAAVCREEFNSYPENRRRVKWKKGWQGKTATSVNQVMCESADIANTVLKMAKKRAYVDMILTSTAASDAFDQDIEDLPSHQVPQAPPQRAPMRRPQQVQPQPVQQTPPQAAPPNDEYAAMAEEHAARQQAAPVAPPTQQSPPQQSAPTGNVISDPQRKRFYAKCRGADTPDETVKLYLKENWGIDSSKEITRDIYDECCEWADAQAVAANA